MEILFLVFHLLVDGYSSHFWAITNNVLCPSVGRTYAVLSLRHVPGGVELLGHVVTLLNSLRNSRTFSKPAHSRSV